MTIRERIIELMNDGSYKPSSKEELAVAFDIERKYLEEFYGVIYAMEKEGIIVKTSNGKYGLIDNDHLVTGKLQGHEKGFGFLISKDKSRDDVFIPAENMNGAMHGDQVIVSIDRKSVV